MNVLPLPKVMARLGRLRLCSQHINGFSVLGLIGGSPVFMDFPYV